MNINTVNAILRFIQLIPLVLVDIPLIQSYWQKKNQINGLRRTRVVLIILFSALIVSNIYFFIFSAFRLSRALPCNQIFVFCEKIISIIAYWLLYHLFRHARIHRPNEMERENNTNIKIIKKDVRKIK